MSRDSKAQRKPSTSPMESRDGHTEQFGGVWWSGTVVGLLLLVCSAQTVWGYSGGMGSPQAPYLIASADDLLELGQNPEDYDKHFLLTADIDLSGYTFDQAVIAASSESPRPSIHFGFSFSGTINGNGHVIRNLNITGSSNLGLFGILGECAQIYSLGVANASITGALDNVGILAAYSEGRIQNSYTSGSVNGHSYVGGLLGENRGYVADCYSTGMVGGAEWIGGLVGSSHFGGEIRNCYSTCAVNPGSADSGPLVGGLVARPSRVSNSFWDAQASGVPDDGTEMGLTTGQMQTASTFLDIGWDFHGEAANGCQETWLMPEGGGYPVLAVFENNVLPTDCAVTIGQCALAVDTNEVLWDAMARFAPAWDSVALTRITKNPATYPEADLKGQSFK